MNSFVRGDVPLITKVLDPADPELYGRRTPRNTVMDFVLEDLNYAVANILQQSSSSNSARTWPAP